jgi:cell wall-associated NlpC family hydrolase
VSDVEHSLLLPHRPARECSSFRRLFSLFAVGVVCISTLTLTTHSAGASNLSNARAKANVLLKQINRMNGEVSLLGQKYDDALLKLHKYNNEIADTKNIVKNIETNETKGNRQLRADVVFAYVTNGANVGNNPLFSKNANKLGATNVYSQLAEGNINATIASLKSDRIELTQEKGILNAEDSHARAVARGAAKSLNKGNVIQAELNHSLAQVKGQIATYVDAAEAAAAAASSSTLQSATPVAGFPAPPPDSAANIAIRTAEEYLGVPYVWGGASKSGVDCSGLVMLAYEAAGIDFPHYSGAMYEMTERVPLYDIQPGDLLFYGPGGDEHVAMYVGSGEMIEAPETGQVVHITPIRLYGGFVGLGRPRA